MADTYDGIKLGDILTEQELEFKNSTIYNLSHKASYNTKSDDYTVLLTSDENNTTDEVENTGAFTEDFIFQTATKVKSIRLHLNSAPADGSFKVYAYKTDATPTTYDTLLYDYDTNGVTDIAIDDIVAIPSGYSLRCVTDYTSPLIVAGLLLIYERSGL